MKINNIELQNFKTIESFTADFSGGVYLVTGENEIGKSTLLGAIGTLLTGKRTDNLLRKGAEKGFAKMEVGEGAEAYTVELRVTEKNPRGIITVEKKDSGLKSSNLTALQGIFKYQDFDAHEFVKWSETAEGRRKQVEMVMSLLPEKVQKRINEIDAEVESTKQKRKGVNADVKAYANLLDKAGVTPALIEKYASPKDLSKLITQKGEAQELAGKVERVKERLQEREEAIAKMPAQVKQVKTVEAAAMQEIDKEEAEAKRQYEATLERLKQKRISEAQKIQEQVKALEQQELEIQKKVKEAKAWLKKQKVPNIEKLQQEINTAEEHNKQAQKVQQFKENRKQYKAITDKKDKLEAAIKKLQEERQQLIDSSDVPVPGLDFSEDGLTLNGIPFRTGEVSTSQEMEVAAKLIIAKNPTVKVFRIAQGESLGKERLQAIVDFADKNGYQGFIEEVHRGQDELIVEKYSEK